jgi:hypothetical protein
MSKVAFTFHHYWAFIKNSYKWEVRNDEAPTERRHSQSPPPSIVMLLLLMMMMMMGVEAVVVVVVVMVMMVMTMKGDIGVMYALVTHT